MQAQNNANQQANNGANKFDTATHITLRQAQRDDGEKDYFLQFRNNNNEVIAEYLPKQFIQMKSTESLSVEPEFFSEAFISVHKSGIDGLYYVHAHAKNDNKSFVIPITKDLYEEITIAKTTANNKDYTAMCNLAIKTQEKENIKKIIEKKDYQKYLTTNVSLSNDDAKSLQLTGENNNLIATISLNDQTKKLFIKKTDNSELSLDTNEDIDFEFIDGTFANGKHYVYLRDGQGRFSLLLAWDLWNKFLEEFPDLSKKQNFLNVFKVATKIALAEAGKEEQKKQQQNNNPVVNNNTTTTTTTITPVTQRNNNSPVVNNNNQTTNTNNQLETNKNYNNPVINNNNTSPIIGTKNNNTNNTNSTNANTNNNNNNNNPTTTNKGGNQNTNNNTSPTTTTITNNDNKNNNTKTNDDDNKDKRPEIEWWMILLCLVLVGIIFIIITKSKQEEYDKKHNKQTKEINTNAMSYSLNSDEQEIGKD